MTKTIAVKIGVVVGSDGTWRAEGGPDGMTAGRWQWLEAALDTPMGGPSVAACRYVVTAELAVPDPIPEIQGKAEEVDG